MVSPMDCWTMDRWETVGEKQIQALVRTNAEMFMWVAAPPSLVCRWEARSRHKALGPTRRTP